MIFNSVSYLIFIFIVVSVYWLLSGKYKTRLILISSLIFYGSWRPEFLLILLFTAMLDFYVAKYIYKAENKNRKFALLTFSIVLNIGLLIYFKYSFFILDNAIVVLNLLGIKKLLIKSERLSVHSVSSVDYSSSNILVTIPVDVSPFSMISYNSQSETNKNLLN